MNRIKKWVVIFAVLGCLFLPCPGEEIHQAAEKGDLARVKALLEDDNALTDARDDTGRTPLHLACYGGHVDLVRFLIGRGADTEARFSNGSTALFWPIPGGHLEVFSFLIESGANISARQNDGTSLLHIAAAFGTREIAEILINRGLDPDLKQDRGSTPLHYAVSRGHRNVVELLIEKGADVNARDRFGYSPVYIAAFRGNRDMIVFLNSRGADLNLKDKSGKTPLHDMAMEGKADIVSLLIENKADFRIGDKNGQTPLLLAANHSRLDVVELLVKKGAEVNRKSDGGDTPLHGAAWIGNQAIVELLIRNGAAVNIKNSDGNTPLDNARLRGHGDVAKMLALHQAGGKEDVKVESVKPISERIISQGIDSPLTFTILYDNYIHQKDTKADWGFSCLVEGAEKVILFDTGTRPGILLHNVKKMGVDLKRVELIVISHDHHDHIGGLPGVLDIHHDVSVYLPVSFTYEIVRGIEARGARVRGVDHPVEICPHVYSTGEMGDRIKEQSLIINASPGLIIVTGCSHQGIVEILKRAKKLFDRPVHLVFGGFHLRGKSDSEMDEIIGKFRELGVEKCGATHCTGDRQIELFKKAFGKDYVPIGTGRILKINHR